MNRLRKLTEAGQAVWLDFIDRDFIKTGGLARLIDQDGLTGVTSNPAIFEKAIGQSDAYDDQLQGIVRARGGDGSIETVYEALAIKDICDACDLLRPVYDRLDAKDGYVSLEVSPHLATDADGTFAAAERLWRTVDRPNLMVKIPGVAAAVPAIERALAAGLNINVTLLFSLDAYAAVLDAHLRALETRVARGQPIDRIASVASVFVSRIDAVIDRKIDEIGEGAPLALRGKVAIANAKMAYQHYLKVTSSPRWRALAAKGARPQRLLWASTGVKDPRYSDVTYVEALIGPDTVNTMPPATMAAFRDHGETSNSLLADVPEAHAVMENAEQLGFDLDGVTARLTDDGVQAFIHADNTLQASIAEKRAAMLGRSASRRLEESAID